MINRIYEQAQLDTMRLSVNDHQQCLLTWLLNMCHFANPTHKQLLMSTAFSEFLETFPKRRGLDKFTGHHTSVPIFWAVVNMSTDDLCKLIRIIPERVWTCVDKNTNDTVEQKVYKLLPRRVEGSKAVCAAIRAQRSSNNKH